MNKKLLLVLFGISGMTALIYEIIWIRPLSLVFGATIYAVSTIIASFILGLAVGSWIAGIYSDKLQNPLKYFAFTQLGVGFYGILLLPIFGALPEIYLILYKATFPNQILFMFIQILMSIGMISIPAALMGTTLPLMMKSYSKEITTIGKDVGKLDASNSFGAVVGTIAAGFLLIPVLGIQNSIIVTASISVIMGMVILAFKKYLKLKYLALIIIIVLPLFIAYPSYDVQSLSTGIYFQAEPDLAITAIEDHINNEKILFYEESMYQSVMVTSNPEGNALKLNGKVQCNLIPKTADGLVRLGSFPIELFEYNYGSPQRGLNIGLGCGVTSLVLSKYMDTTTLEIDPSVVKANKFFHDEIDHNLIVDDARNWLLRNNEKFDIITSEPTEPWNGWQLYTIEYFSLLSNRVSENGLVSQWVPVFELPDDNFTIFYNTFHSVFPYVYVYYMEPDDLGQLIFIGSQKPLKIKNNDQYLFNHEDFREIITELNTDDNPILEFNTALNLYDSGVRIYIPLKEDVILPTK